MFLDIQDYGGFSFGAGTGDAKKALVVGLDGEPTNPSHRRHQQRLAFAEFYRKQNARLRKPCPKCGTLVQPKLLGQHYDAYHPGTAHPSN
jgi:ribosomal protein S27AE